MLPPPHAIVGEGPQRPGRQLSRRGLADTAAGSGG
eukprot:COSAG05_NODE_26702_length_183_cov_199.107143_1_plen_34_part_10